MEADLNKALQAKVLHQYKPQDKHELRLRPGDVITEVEKLDQGWCKVRIFMVVINHGRHMPNAIITTSFEVQNCRKFIQKLVFMELNFRK